MTFEKNGTSLKSHGQIFFHRVVKKSVVFFFAIFFPAFFSKFAIKSWRFIAIHVEICFSRATRCLL